MATSDSIHAGLRLLGVNWALVAVSAVFLALHVFVRIKVQRRLGWDDYVLFFSWIFITVSTGVAVLAVGKGLGRHQQQVSDADLDSLALLLCISSVFYSLAIAWSKSAFALRLLRVVTGSVKLVLWSAIIVINAVYTFSAVLGFVRCSPSNRAWDSNIPGSCWDISSVRMFSIVAAGVSAAITFLLVLLPWVIIPKLQLISLERVGLTICMTVGIIAGAIAIRRSAIEPSMWTQDITFDAADCSIWLTAEIAATIIAAALPNLRFLSKSRNPHGGSSFTPTAVGTEMTSVTAVAAEPPSSSSPKNTVGRRSPVSRGLAVVTNKTNKAYNKKYSQHSDFDGTFKSKVFAHTTTITSSASQRRAKREAAKAAQGGGGGGGLGSRKGSLRRTASKASMKKKENESKTTSLKKKKTHKQNKSSSATSKGSSKTGGGGGASEIYYDHNDKDNANSSSPPHTPSSPAFSFSYPPSPGKFGVVERRDSDVRSSMATFRAILATVGQRVTASRLDQVVAVQSTVTVTHDDNDQRSRSSVLTTTTTTTTGSTSNNRAARRSRSNVTGTSPITPTGMGGGRPPWFGLGSDAGSSSSSRRGSEAHQGGGGGGGGGKKEEEEDEEGEENKVEGKKKEDEDEDEVNNSDGERLEDLRAMGSTSRLGGNEGGEGDDDVELEPLRKGPSSTDG